MHAARAFARRYTPRLTSIFAKYPGREWITLEQFDAAWLATADPSDPVIYAGCHCVKHLLRLLSHMDIIFVVSTTENGKSTWEICVTELPVVEISRESEFHLTAYCPKAVVDKTRRL